MNFRTHLIPVSALLPMSSICHANPVLTKLYDKGYLLFVGQDNQTIDEYHESGFFPTAGGVVTYTSLYTLRGLREYVDYGSGPVHASVLVEKYPDSALMIGLALMDEEGISNGLNRIANGEFDDQIISLAEFVRDLERPVFVRIGYEFDGPWYGYSPEPYKAAYRRIVNLSREIAPNFINVWHSVAYVSDPSILANLGKTYTEYMMDWYPGDEYVDWTGVTWFTHLYETTAQEFVDLSRKLNKPVMMAETAPMSYDLEDATYGSPVDNGSVKAGDIIDTDLSADEIWNRWFQPMINFMEKNDCYIHAICYINTHWDSQPMWKRDTETGNYQGLYWGDSRLQANPGIAKKWQDLISSSKWINRDELDFKDWMIERN
ncbi:MAG: glycoside hydrolase family 26 protein [Opitutales bacterium]|nr:glycoside hydrolase family 26 protein [Opitutales bacterium]